MADRFQGTVESLLRVEDRERPTILDFTLRSGSKAQRVKSRLEVADWVREGDVVEADGKKDNEGVLVADRLGKISLPAPARPGWSRRLRFLWFLMLVSFLVSLTDLGPVGLWLWIPAAFVYAIGRFLVRTRQQSPH